MPPLAEPGSLIPTSEFVDDCELILLGRTGLLLPAADATNRFVGVEGFFLLDVAGETADEVRISRPLAPVLPDDVSSLVW